MQIQMQMQMHFCNRADRWQPERQLLHMNTGSDRGADAAPDTAAGWTFLNQRQAGTRLQGSGWGRGPGGGHLSARTAAAKARASARPASAAVATSKSQTARSRAVRHREHRGACRRRRRPSRSGPSAAHCARPPPLPSTRWVEHAFGASLVHAPRRSTTMSCRNSMPQFEVRIDLEGDPLLTRRLHPTHAEGPRNVLDDTPIYT